MEEKIIISFLAYGHPQEMEFDANVRFKKVHAELSEVCATYVITNSYVTHKKIEYPQTDLTKIKDK